MPLKIDHLSLLARDLERSARHYDALLPLLGFSKLRDHVWSDGEGLFIQLQQARDDTRPYERYGPGVNHLGFSAPTVQAVHDIRQKMSEAGFAMPEIQHLGGASALFIPDPDGLRTEVTYYPPGMAVVD